MSSTAQSLTQLEAQARAAQLEVLDHAVELDLDSGDETFTSRSTIRFRNSGGETFLDVKPVSLRRVRLNGSDLDVSALAGGRFPVPASEGENELVVEAVMPFRTDGEGLHHHVDPADGRRYVYGMSFMDAAPSIFACFDQPDLKAPYTFTVRAPRDWTVTGNAPGTHVGDGVWQFEKTRPLSTYFVTLVAGPYHHITDEHDGIRLGLSARRSIARNLEADAPEILTVTKQCFDEFHRLFGIRYAFGDYHQAFVPEFNAGAMENPGCVTFRDPMIFTSRATRGAHIQRAVTIAHEMAHQWFGNLVTPVWWDDLWLNESFAEYMGNRVAADATEFTDAWVHNAHRRRQWGLVADQRPSTHPVAGNGARDAATALQDFDGISYAKGSSVLKQLAASVGDDVFLAGAVDHFNRHRFGNATMHDLFDSWERAGAGDLSGFIVGWLRTAGVDELAYDRAEGALVRRTPTEHPADREHTVRVATASPGQPWRTTTVTLGADPVRFEAAPDAAVLVDPFQDSWSRSHPDAESLAALPGLLPETTDPMLRAGIWNSLRSGVHAGAVSAEAVLAVLAAGLPGERDDDAVNVLSAWALGRLRAVTDPATVEDVVQDSAGQVLDAAPSASTLQLAAFGAVVSSSGDVVRLRAWLRREDLPTGLELDEALRWRINGRLAELGAITETELLAELQAEPTVTARVEYAGARASLPDPEQKAWAWERFTGAEPASNYELKAIGNGFWQRGQEELTAPYVQRYLDELQATAEVFSGWVLADVAEAFFPITALDAAVLDRVQALASDDALAAPLQRRVADMADELSRRIGNHRCSCEFPPGRPVESRSIRLMG